MAAVWSVVISDSSGEILIEENPDAVLSIASVGKILLLLAIAQRFSDDELETIHIDRATAIPVADSGLWQHLDAVNLSLHDLVVLVASLSDNWATNALIENIGLPSVWGAANAWGLIDTKLLDLVRDVRDESTAPRLAEGTARELHSLVTAIADSAPGSPGDRVASWLQLNTDLSLVASAFGLDPLAHVHSDGPVALWNKTGTDSGVLADVGIITGPRAEVRYAVVVNSENADGAAHTRELRDAMRTWGAKIAEITGL
jgi:beta-lactamase class A